nr:immunoglobulin heavy chain junction region [Mus musculus]
CARTWDYFDFW